MALFETIAAGLSVVASLNTLFRNRQIQDGCAIDRVASLTHPV